MTNPKRVGKAINEKSCNSLLLKVNQIGSITESIEEVKMSKHVGWGEMTSHCSGETEDTFIIDLAVGFSMGQIKTGVEAMFADLGHFNKKSIHLAFSVLIYPSLLIMYTGQTYNESRWVNNISHIYCIKKYHSEIRWRYF